MKGRVLFIQLTRTGDLVQTVQAVRQFKSENTEIDCHLVARQKFAKGIEFLLETVFSKIVCLDTKSLLAEGTFVSGIENLDTLINEINTFEYDVSVNFSYNKSSAYLHSLVNSQQKIGLVRNTKNELVVGDPWSQFVFSNVMRGTNTPFNLVDIFRYTIGCKETHVLQASDDIQREKDIVIHPFASSKKKRWGASKWTEVLFRLNKTHPDYKIHIVGGPEDKIELSKIINSPALQKSQGSIISHVGSYSIKDTYKLLQTASLVICHDSLVSHLAAETLTPTIVLSLGTVRPHETTAYNDKLVNLVPKNGCFPCKPQESCDLLPCHNSIHHQVVSKISEYFLKGEGTITDALLELSPLHLNNTKVYHTYYSENGLQLKEMTGHYSDLNDVFKKYYEIVFQYYLRGVDVNMDLPDITQESAKTLSHYIDGTQHLFELYNFGVKYCNQIISKSESKNPDYKDIQQDINKLSEIDQLCQLTQQNYPLLANLIDFFYVNKANTPGNNLVEIAKSNLLCFYDASNLVAVLNEFVRKTAETHLDVTDSIKEV